MDPCPASSSVAGDPSPPPPPPPPQQQQQQQPPSRYESQKRRDWNTFLQYLRSHRPPLSLASCSGAHVIEFLKYLDQFGKTKVHAPGCTFFGHPNPPAPCVCPLKQAWGSLDALIGRLRAAYEENDGHQDSNPFGARAVGVYLRQVKENQAKARGIPYEKKKKKRKRFQDTETPSEGRSVGGAGAEASLSAAVAVSSASATSTSTVAEAFSTSTAVGDGSQNDKWDLSFPVCLCYQQFLVQHSRLTAQASKEEGVGNGRRDSMKPIGMGMEEKTWAMERGMRRSRLQVCSEQLVIRQATSCWVWGVESPRSSVVRE
ncbi:hypothetical protein BHM03_00024788 [Ensete ventricosum]|uniref:ALOG domain-containing protein n=1 Tax=Ensete ventricosum TaxID=4639 RepID=A0A445MGZ7_ENSVE|nr:hypothetical protein BHM03_00024788 [Ensete ventricosum]